MKTFVFINPLKPGKLEEYKRFSALNTGEKQKDYADLLKRCGWKNVKVYHHVENQKESVIVVHDAEDDAITKSPNFPLPNHPYDKWFLEQLNDLHPTTENNQTQLLFEFDVS